MLMILVDAFHKPHGVSRPIRVTDLCGHVWTIYVLKHAFYKMTCPAGVRPGFSLRFFRQHGRLPLHVNHENEADENSGPIHVVIFKHFQSISYTINKDHNLSMFHIHPIFGERHRTIVTFQ